MSQLCMSQDMFVIYYKAKAKDTCVNNNDILWLLWTTQDLNKAE